MFVLNNDLIKNFKNSHKSAMHQGKQDVKKTEIKKWSYKIEDA